MDGMSKEEAVVSYLKSIANYTEPKPSYYITVSGRSSSLETNFTPPLMFKPECRYEIACCGIETYYSFPNIDEEDNKVQISLDKGTSWKQLEIPTGCYDIKAINTVLKRLIKKNGGKEEEVEFCLAPNKNTLQSIIIIIQEYKFTGPQDLYKLLRCFIGISLDELSTLRQVFL